jgi:predicted NAD/FAD-binding protein
VKIKTSKGVYEFDMIVMATHTDQALKILGTGATNDERRILGSIPYKRNKAYVHSDEAWMPKNRSAWSSWNYIIENEDMCLTYWMNKLQTFLPKENVFVTLNPSKRPENVVYEIEYEHPVYAIQVLYIN